MKIRHIPTNWVYDNAIKTHDGYRVRDYVGVSSKYCTLCNVSHICYNPNFPATDVEVLSENAQNA
jgi:hypothetical protein